MNGTLIWILGTFAAYMLMMLLIGAAYMKTGKSSAIDFWQSFFFYSMAFDSL